MKKPLNKLFLILFLIGISILSYLVVGHRLLTSQRSASILFDDSHSNWAWAGGPFDSDAFGERRLYESRLFLDFVSSYHNISINTSDDLSLELLSKYDIIILKTPTKPYSRAEIEAIHKYVHGGGRLFAIGDHTNLYGMSDYLNSVVSPMGIKFISDDQFDLASGGPSVYKPSVFHNKHPILEDLSSLEFMTGCTLQTNNGRSVLSVTESGHEMMDYSQVSFFGDIKLQQHESFGRYSLIAESKFGNGNVIALSDSTIMSNFSVQNDSKLQLFVNIFQYLANPTSSWISDNSKRYVIFSMAFAVIAISTLNRGNVLLFALLSVLVGGSTSLVMQEMRMLSTTFVPKNKYRYVEFDLRNSDALLGQTLENNQNTIKHPKYFDSFFMNFARIDVKPFWADHFEHDFPPALRVFLRPYFSVEAKSAILDGDIDSLIVMDFSNLREQLFCRKLCGLERDDGNFLDVLSRKAVSSLELPSGMVIFKIQLENKSLYFGSPPDLFSRVATGPVYNNPSVKELESLKDQIVALRWILGK